jgi:SurA N-terminal domain
MIGSIRKHSKWLWWIIAALTVFSFVVFMGQGPMRNGGSSRASGGYGTIYGKAITALEYAQAQREFYLYYWVRNGQWPDKSASFNRDDMEREVYIRLLLQQKAKKLGVEIGDDALVAAASQFLSSLGRNGQSVPMQKFEEQVLAPEGLAAIDLQNFLRSELTVQQMVQTLGLAGALITPQEVSSLYDREHQELSAQAVFFAASNYLAQASVTPSAVAEFYTNNLAAYRVPDRVQVNYVFFDVSNYLAQAQTEWSKTNFTETVNAVYQQYGQSQFPEAKTPDEAKAKIREVLIHDRALKDARQVANDFAVALFAVEPVKPENLATLAAQKGLAVRTTAPFSANLGPEEFTAPATFTKSAFQLSADEPLAGPIVGADGIYVIALANQLPSSIPSLEQISSRVTQDFKNHAAVELAQNAGRNLYYSLTTQAELGKTFAQVAVAAGHTPLVLPAFSLSTSAMPELDDRASLGQIKQAAFTTAPGHASNFVPTADGGFILFVQQMLPMDMAKKNSELAQFTAQVRRGRQSEAFNLWLQGQANRELRNTPFFEKMAAGAAKKP